MSEGSDQAPRCLVGELRVRIERDNETDPGEAVQAAAEHSETRVAVTPEQAVELDELAALAFPTHPAVLVGIPHPPAMAKKEPLRLAGAVALVEGLDPLKGALHVAIVFGHLLVRRIREIGKQGEMQRRVRI